MSVQIAARLTRSLSGPEKRFFKLNTPQHAGNKDYLDLFNLIDSDKSADAATIKKQFLKKHPGKSVANTSRYLADMLMDALLRLKTGKDPFFQSMYHFMLARILRERSLLKESLKQLNKVSKDARRYQQHFVEYLAHREELDYLAAANFAGVSDTRLIGMQMKAKEVLKSIHYIHDHYSLFELLKYRLLHQGKVSSADEQKRLNDLMLSEMTLVSGKSKNSFASQKLHLLFQSFFFTDVGDYQSALKTFDALNKVFEDNKLLLDHPPLDYLSALTGILDSLHALGHFEKMPRYLEEANGLDQQEYPAYFRYLVRKTTAVYSLVMMIAARQFDTAVELVEKNGHQLLYNYPLADEGKQWELYFYCALAYFGLGDFKKSQQFISEAMRSYRVQPQLLVCKAIRLLDIIIYYERNEDYYLQYEIRSYKRFFRQHRKLLACESLLFKTIGAKPRRKVLPLVQQKKIAHEINAIRQSKYELQLLKFFDWMEWMCSKFAIANG